MSQQHDDENRPETAVERALKSQRDSWQEISNRVAQFSSREFPHEPPKRILLFGVGSSYFAARLTAFALIKDKSRVRIPVVACSSLAIGLEVLPTRGDWAFGFTHRGGTPATLRALEHADRAGAFTLQVSGNKAHQSESARFLLSTVELEEVEPHTKSLTGAICAVTSLIGGAKAVEEWDAVRSIGDPDISVFRRRAGSGPAVILGEWEGEWIAREGALKLAEMARLPVHVYGSEEFFHGPKYAWKPEDSIWHVSVPKDPRNADISALRPSHTVGIFGASPLAWIPALVEMQWLALAVALNRGENPDLRG